MGGFGVKVQHFPLTLLVVLTTLTLPCERDDQRIRGFLKRYALINPRFTYLLTYFSSLFRFLNTPLNWRRSQMLNSVRNLAL